MRAGLIAALLTTLVTLTSAPSLAAQASLESAAERARRAWQAHEPADLVGRTDRLSVSLPAMAPSEALAPAQAIALFRDLFGKAVELETSIRAVRETAVGVEGYAELRRRFRAAGTQEVAQQTILLAFRRQSGQWVLHEVRVLE